MGIGDWDKLIEEIELYGINNIYFYYLNQTKEYLLKNKDKINFFYNFNYNFYFKLNSYLLCTYN